VLAKFVGILFISVGAAGLILPVIPGILLITVGVLLFFKDKEYKIIKLINEKAPPHFAAFYHDFLSRIVNGGHHIGVDWRWVADQMHKRERIGTGGAGGERDLAIQSILDKCLAEARSLIKPNYIREEKKIISSGNDFIELEGGVRLSVGKIARYIGGAKTVVLFLVTISDKIESRAGELTKGKEPLEGYLLDRIGSFAVESLAEAVENKIRKDHLKINKSVSRRYSPGYCDWPIEEQRILSGIIDFSQVGVSLNESCMMKPKKSISAIVAIADIGVFTGSGSTCGTCEKDNCAYRRNGVGDI